ncbi:MAG TPA: hypothetical protein VM141_03500 [Planctomycetota bacterium]|nr:hypothetical protein [Planctomycetota bacterium]
MGIHERLEAFWAGERPDQIPFTVYYWLRKDVNTDPTRRAKTPSPDGRRLAFEVSEHLPLTWKQSFPQVADAVRETRAR